MSPDDLDEAVDRALREIMSAEPARDLTGRVLDRIAEPAPRSWSGVEGMALVACLMLLLVMAPRVLHEWQSGSASPANDRKVAMTGAEPATPAVAVPVQQPPFRADASSAPVASEDMRRPHERMRGPRAAGAHRTDVRDSVTESSQARSAVLTESILASAEDPWPAMGVAIEQLTPISPISVPPVRQAPLRMDEITIHPLEIEPLDVEPLSSPAQQ